MAWFKKKKETTSKEQNQEINSQEIPELPELPSLPKPHLPFNQPMLPSLPSQEKESFEPISPPQYKKYEKSIPHMPKLDKSNIPLTKEISSGKEEVESDFQPNRIGVRRFKSMPQALEISEPQVPRLMPLIKEEKTEPVFVRIDKYQAAVQAFNEIKSKLNEIENYLREIKNLKHKEEQELEEWENEIETIKTRLNNIDQGVFGKLS